MLKADDSPPFQTAGLSSSGSSFCHIENCCVSIAFSTQHAIRNTKEVTNYTADARYTGGIIDCVIFHQDNFDLTEPHGSSLEGASHG